MRPWRDSIASVTGTQGGKAVKTLRPIAVACTSCHADNLSAAHVDTTTSQVKGEARAVCHGKGHEFDVAKMHKP